MNIIGNHIHAPKNTGDAGYDISIPYDIVVLHGEIIKIDTQTSVAIPNNHFGMIVPRSGFGGRGLTVANTPGIIDSGYRGNIVLALYYFGEKNRIFLEEGSRVAQLIIVPYHTEPLINVMSHDVTERGNGGFGSTGVLS